MKNNQKNKELTMKVENKSGIYPTGGHILILPDDIEEADKTYRSAKQAGLVLPDTARDKEQAAATSGIIIAIGATAWSDIDDGTPWASIGDRVSYGRYAGKVIQGKDNVDYTLLNDNDILAKLIFEEEE
jgi:co-chaperonin GroES (HSP10)